MKRLFALMLCLVMALSVIPATAAEDVENTEAVEPEAVSNGLISIDSENFPDPEFRSFIRIELDEDGDGYLSAEEISEVQTIASYWGEGTYDVHSLEGLRFFTALTSLNCEGWQLGGLDVSQNPHLESLDCTNCGLYLLDVTHNPELTNLLTSGNHITSLQIGNCPHLVEAYHSASGETGDSIWYSGAGVYLFIDKTTTIDTTPVIVKPIIMTQPKSASAKAGSTASFTVSATGGNLGYQWQWRKNSSASWSNCTSATTGYNKATLKVSATAARNGYQYRCKVYNSAGSVYSSVVTLNVLAVTSSPTYVSTTAGKTATFKVAAIGKSLTYRWQWRKNSSDSWKDCTSATTGYNKTTLKVSATEARNGYQYRCRVRDSAGNTVYSKKASLYVLKSQPSSASVAAGKTATFTVSAYGGSLKYQWQWRKNASDSWKNCTSVTTGYNKATLKVTATAARNGYQYRCRITSSERTVYSATVKLTVK